MRKTNKKGFTIVELVIVIAVIAILAAVLIPTYSSLVKKANESADIQAVRQMNTILATYADGSVSNVKEAIEALDKENIDLENYKPMQKEHYFYFYMDDNTPKTVYMDKNNKVVFPTDAKVDGKQLMSLSGDVPTDGSWYKTDTVNSDGTAEVSISSGAQMADMMNNVSKLLVDSSVKKILITLQNDINMMGSSASFGTVTKEIVLDGNGKTISGLRADRNTVNGSWDNETKTLGHGLFNIVKNNVTVKNLKVSNCVVSNSDSVISAFGMSAVLFGKIEGNVSVHVDNVEIDSCTVFGGDKAGALIGFVTGGADVSFTKVNVSKTAVSGIGAVAKVIGAVDTNVKSVTFGEGCSFDVAVSVNEADWTKIWWTKADKPNNWDKNWDGNEVTPEDNITVDGNVYTKACENNANILKMMLTNDLYWKVTASGDESTVQVDGKQYSIWKTGSESFTNP